MKVWNSSRGKFEYVNPLEVQVKKNEAAVRLMKATEKDIPKRPLPEIKQDSKEDTSKLVVELAERGKWSWSKHAYVGRTGSPGHYQYKYTGSQAERTENKPQASEQKDQVPQKRSSVFNKSLPRTGADLKAKVTGGVKGSEFQQVTRRPRKTTQPTAQTNTAPNRVPQGQIGQRPQAQQSNWLIPQRPMPQLQTADANTMVDQAKEAGNVFNGYGIEDMKEQISPDHNMMYPTENEMMNTEDSLRAFATKINGDLYVDESDKHYIVVSRDGGVFDFSMDIQNMPIRDYLKKNQHAIKRA